MAVPARSTRKPLALSVSDHDSIAEIWSLDSCSGSYQAMIAPCSRLWVVERSSSWRLAPSGTIGWKVSVCGPEWVGRTSP